MKRSTHFILPAALLFFSLALHAQPRRPFAPADMLRVAEVSDAQVSPDGAWVVYVVSTSDGDTRRSSLWLARASVPTVQTAEVGVVPVVAPPARLNLSDMNATRPRWSPDGRRVAFTGARGGHSGVWVIELTAATSEGDAREAARQPRLVAEMRETNFHIPYAGEPFAWSPDSRRIAFVSAIEETDEEDASINLSSSASGASDGGASSSARGKRDDPRVIGRIRYKSRTSFSDRLRTHVFVAEVDAAEEPPRQLTSGKFYDHALSWNPRGDEIAFLSNREPDPDAVHNSDIFVVDTEARTRRVTNTKGSEYEPAWSPDGRLIAHTATTRDVTTIDSVAEDAHVWVADASGGGGRREISAALDRRARSPRWSSDSLSVFFLANDRGRTNLYRVAASGANMEEVVGRAAHTSDTCRPGTPAPLPPFQVTGFAVGARQHAPVALTISNSTHPAEVWVYQPTGCLKLRRASAHNESLVRERALAVPDEIIFRSFDGTTIQGWLLKPFGSQLTSGRRHPLILRVHGGPHGMYGYGFDATSQAYAARGYAVLYLNPRGSTGYGQKFSDGTFREWGGGDYRDLMLGVDEVLRRHSSWIDAERLGVTGGSYGGFMTNWIVTQTPRFRAAVASASVSNLVSFYGTSLYQDLIHAEFGGFPWDDYEILWRWSPLRNVRAVQTPVLFLHGELDNDVPVTQAEEMYTALRRRGVETQLVRYPREGHSMREPAHRLDALERTLGWFDKFLK